MVHEKVFAMLALIILRLFFTVYRHSILKAWICHTNSDNCHCFECQYYCSSENGSALLSIPDRNNTDCSFVWCSVLWVLDDYG